MTDSTSEKEYETKREEYEAKRKEYEAKRDEYEAKRKEYEAKRDEYEAKRKFAHTFKETPAHLLNELKETYKLHRDESKKIFTKVKTLIENECANDIERVEKQCADDIKRIEKQCADDKKRIEKRKDDKLKKCSTMYKDYINKLNKQEKQCSKIVTHDVETYQSQLINHNNKHGNDKNSWPQLLNQLQYVNGIDIDSPINNHNECVQEIVSQSNDVSINDVSINDRKQSESNEIVQQLNIASNLMEQDNINDDKSDDDESSYFQASNLANISTDTSDTIYTSDSCESKSSIVRRTSRRNKVICVCGKIMKYSKRIGIHVLDGGIKCNSDGCSTVITDINTLFWYCDNFIKHGKVCNYLCESCSAKTIPIQKKIFKEKRIKARKYLKKIFKQNKSDERPYKCACCEKRFKTRQTMNVHARIHTGEKPYKCVTCSKRFTQKSNLTQHMNSNRSSKKCNKKKCNKKKKIAKEHNS
eukprot:304886_1